MAWTDYQKAFDRVPHRWIIKSLEIIGINSKVIYEEVHELLENTYVPTCRKKADRYRRHKNKMWNISRGFTITAVILYLPTPSH
jgi:hypothetical protein